jgi:hypothetical protein
MKLAAVESAPFGVGVEVGSGGWTAAAPGKGLISTTAASGCAQPLRKRVKTANKIVKRESFVFMLWFPFTINIALRPGTFIWHLVKDFLVIWTGLC